MRYDRKLSTDEYTEAVFYWSNEHKETAPQSFFEGIYYQKYINRKETKQ